MINCTCKLTNHDHKMDKCDREVDPSTGSICQECLNQSQ